MPLFLVLSVTWLTLVVVIIGACATAGRADREAAAQTLEMPPIPVPMLAARRFDAPGSGASTVGRTPVRRPRRGAHASSRQPRLARR